MTTTNVRRNTGIVSDPNPRGETGPVRSVKPTGGVEGTTPADEPAARLDRGTRPDGRYTGADTTLRAPVEGQRAPDGTIRAGTLADADRARMNRPPYDASRDATELYEAMHGGLMGVGTDEERIFRALDGKTPDQIRSIRETYRDHYQRDLDADLRDELGGSDLRRAEAQLQGDRAAADADALHQAMDGVGTDEEAIFRTLEGKSPAEREAIQRAYRERQGRELSADLDAELGGGERDRARALLRGDDAAAEAARLHAAMDGIGTDEDAVFRSLEGKSPEQRAAIEQSYRAQYGRELRDDLRSELGGAELDRAEAARQGDTARADAGRIRAAMDGLGTDESSIEAALAGRSADERAAIERAYRDQYGTELRADLRSELGGDDLARAEALLDRGQLSDAERLHSAIDGLGTDEDTIRQVLEGRSREEIDAIRADYRVRYDRDLDTDLRADLSGRDAFDVDMALRGRATSPEEALRRMNEVHAYERGGALNAPGRFVTDLFNDHGRNLDRNTARANAEFRAATADGSIDAAESERLARTVGYQRADVGSYRAGKDAAADAVGTTAAVAASVAVVVGTAGTGTPLVVTALGAAAAGGTARVVGSGLVHGQGYGWEAAASDAGLGAIDGATAVVGMGAGRVAGGAVVAGARVEARTALTRAGVAQTERLVEMTTAELLERSAARRVAVRVAEGTTDGVVAGGLGGGLGTAARDGTWDDGFGEGLRRVGSGAGTGAVLGGVAGGTVAAPFGLRRTSAFDMVDGSRVWVDRNMPNNVWRDWGEYSDQLAVNRAVDPNPRTVSVAGPNGPVDVRVYGAVSQREAETVAESVRRLEAVGANEAIPREIHLRTRVGQFLDANGRVTGEVGGLGGAGDTMIMVRGQAGTRAGADHVIHHEAGHNLDARRGWISGDPNTPFGRGPSVSSYGAKNAAEDFAETHRVVIAQWENILRDPDRYIHHNGPIGEKFKWILENIYGQTIPPPTVPVTP